MKLSLFENHRARRERRLLARAMRETAMPVPPEGLKERLIEQAQAAGRQASMRPRRSLARAILAASAFVVALAAAAGWFAWNGGQGAKPVKRLPARQDESVTAVQQTPPPRALEKPKSRLAQQRPLVKRKMVAQGGAIRKHRPYSGGVKPVRDALPITVTVGRADTKTIRYARAAAWGVDDDGRPVKTQWTLVDDPRSRVSSEQLTKTDASGRAVLVVAVVTPSDDGNPPKGDQL